MNNFVYAHALSLGIAFNFVVLSVALFFSVWGGLALFKSLAGKNSKIRAALSFVWYAILFAYFWIFFYGFVFALLTDTPLTPYNLGLLSFEGGKYIGASMLVSFLAGLAILIFLAKKSSDVPLNAGYARSLWLGARKSLLAALILFFAIIASRIPAYNDKQRTAEVVNKIHSSKITLDDVMGKNLPPPPDPKANDATLEGIDANNNGIRDDVELAIFKMYPNSARVRAAELQYAKALQVQLTPDVFNSDTLVASLQEAGRGYLCLGTNTLPIKPSDTLETRDRISTQTDNWLEEVKGLVFNTQTRKDRRQQIFDYMKSYSDLKGPDCDIAPASLPN